MCCSHDLLFTPGEPSCSNSISPPCLSGESFCFCAEVCASLLVILRGGGSKNAKLPTWSLSCSFYIVSAISTFIEVTFLFFVGELAPLPTFKTLLWMCCILSCYMTLLNFVSFMMSSRSLFFRSWKLSREVICSFCLFGGWASIGCFLGLSGEGLATFLLSCY